MSASETPLPQSRRRERLGIALRAAVGLGLLVLLVRKVGWASLAPVLTSPRWGFLAVSALFSVLLIGVSCAKWQILLRARRVRVGFARLFGLYLVGMLFNNFLPSNVGGDLVRSIGLGRYTRQMSDSLATVFVERFTGFVALVACAWIGFLFEPDLFAEAPLVGGLVLATGTLAGAVWALADDRLLGWLELVIPFRVVRSLFARARPVLGSIRGFRELRLIAVTMALSLVFYALAVLNVFFSAQVFGGAPDLGGLAAVVPIVLVASLLPISIGGIGLAEWAYVVCLAQIGVPDEEALAVALVLRAKIVVLGILGGFVFLALRHEPPPASSEAA